MLVRNGVLGLHAVFWRRRNRRSRYSQLTSERFPDHARMFGEFGGIGHLA